MTDESKKETWWTGETDDPIKSVKKKPKLTLRRICGYVLIAIGVLNGIAATLITARTSKLPVGSICLAAGFVAAGYYLLDPNKMRPN
jgi:hypothetical protein